MSRGDGVEDENYIVECFGVRGFREEKGSA